MVRPLPLPYPLAGARWILGAFLITPLRTPIYLILFFLSIFFMLGLIPPLKAATGIDFSLWPGFILSWVLAGGNPSFTLNSANPADWAVLVAGVGSVVLVVGLAGRALLRLLLRRPPTRRERFFALCGLALGLCLALTASFALSGLVKGDAPPALLFSSAQVLAIALVFCGFGLFSYSLAEIFEAGGEFIAGQWLANKMVSALPDGSGQTGARPPFIQIEFKSGRR